MAQVGCLCGAHLSDINAPSEAIIYIYLKSEVESLIQKQSETTVWDFYEETFTEHLYWYCKCCGRVFRYEDNKRSAPNIYKREPSSEQPMESSRELLVFTDLEIDRVTEQNIQAPLKDYIYSHNQQERYFVDKTNKGYVVSKRPIIGRP